MKYAITAELYVNTKANLITATNYLVNRVGYWLDDNRDQLKITRDESLGKLIFDCRFDNLTERNNCITAITNNQAKFVKGIVETHDCRDDENKPCDNFMQVAKWGW